MIRMQAGSSGSASAIPPSRNRSGATWPMKTRGRGQAWSAANASAFLYAPVPTLDEAGLGALIAVVAGVAGWALRRRGRR